MSSTHTHTHTHTHTYTHTQMHTHTHIHTQGLKTHTHTCTCTHAHTHNTHTQYRFVPPPPSGQLARSTGQLHASCHTHGHIPSMLRLKCAGWGHWPCPRAGHHKRCKAQRCVCVCGVWVCESICHTCVCVCVCVFEGSICVLTLTIITNLLDVSTSKLTATTPLFSGTTFHGEWELRSLFQALYQTIAAAGLTSLLHTLKHSKKTTAKNYKLAPTIPSEKVTCEV